MTDYLKENQEVLKKVQSLAKKREFGCVSVIEIAKILRKDPRTIRNHLQIMQNYDYGLFLDEKKTFFLAKTGFGKVLNKIKGKI